MKIVGTLSRLGFFAVLACIFLVFNAFAEPSIHFNEKSKLFFLDDGKISYIFGINEQNGLQHVYWGKHIEREEDFSAVHTSDEWASFDIGTTRTPQEYPGWGAGLYVEPSLKITFPDGNRDLVLHYVDHKIEGFTLTVNLKDIERELYVHLRYALYPNAGILRREASIENRTGKPLVVESVKARCVLCCVVCVVLMC